MYRIRGQVTQEQVVTLAKSLGLEDVPVAEGGSWRIGGKDGSGPTLRVDREAPGAWTFSRNTPGTDNCKGATCKAPSGGDGPVVSEEAARKAAAPVLKAAGQDEAKLDASQVMGGSRVVNADPEVGGLPTYGWTTGVVVGAQGEVVGGNGRLGEPVKGDSYPVVSAADALKQLNDAPGAGDRAEIGGCAGTEPLGEESCATREPSKGDTVTVGDAVFGLASHSVDGRPALVPSWLFEVRPQGAEETFTVTYPAVDPEFLAPRSGSGETGPAPTKPGDEPTSAPSDRDVAVAGYTAEGAELTVTFTGGVCSDYKVTASEDGGRVTVRVTETPWPDKVCILIAKDYQQTVRLDAPLGDRAVVGTDGDPVPLHKDGARLPAPPTR
ncbi:membrane protein [Streptomyces sp. KM77-8]|uniref:Membrane protein n=1 Tax=Streptomyces haneummycinicus TaxID=3074435 RepID=A0AAT9HTY6_9ACTN